MRAVKSPPKVVELNERAPGHQRLIQAFINGTDATLPARHQRNPFVVERRNYFLR